MRTDPGHLRQIWQVTARVLTGIVVAVALLLGWGMLVEPRLIDEVELTAVVPRLPLEWEGKRVALLGDIQVGMWLNNTATARKIVRRLVEVRPDLVLLAGDFIYHPLDDDEDDGEARREWERGGRHAAQQEIRTARDILRPLIESHIPTYAVLGNHDYAMDQPGAPYSSALADELQDNLERAGIPVLRNVAIALEPPGGRRGSRGTPLYLVGIDASYPHRDRPRMAVSQVPDGAPRIVLMHNPDSFLGLPAHLAPLALAGHTHGGQIRIPFLPHWSWLHLVKSNLVEADGWAAPGTGAPGNRLYVNRGIGFSEFPIRINCRPELTLFTLQRPAPLAGPGRSK